MGTCDVLLKRLLLLGLLLIPGVAFGQGAVLQQGTVFAGHDAMWMSDGHIGDAGGPLGNGIPPVDPTFGLLPLGAAYVNSGLGVCQFSNYALTPYALLCSGFDGSGNALFTYTNIASPPGKVTFDINGINYPFPGAGDGDVLGPPSSVGGDLAAFNGTSGNLLEDSGILAADLVFSSGTPAAGDAVIWTGTGLGAKDAGAPPVLEVSTLASLEALSTVTASQVLRLGVNTAGDAPPLLFTASGSPCTISGGDIGSQVTSSNGLCWLAQYAQGVPINPLEFGAKLNGATNDAVTLNAVLAYAGAASSAGAEVEVNCGGRTAALSTNVEETGNYVSLDNCRWVPLAGFTPTQGTGDAMVVMTGIFDEFSGNYCDGQIGTANIADCIEMQGQTSTITDNTIYHYPNFAIKYNEQNPAGSSSGGYIARNFTAEWRVADTQFPIQADYVGKGIWLIGGDFMVAYNLPHYTEDAFYLGDGDVTQGATGGTFVGNHPFNGCQGVVGCTKTDPIDIYIDRNSFNNTFVNTYIDDGLTYSENSENTFLENHFIKISTTTLSARFNFVATSAAQKPSVLNIFGPNDGNSTSVPLMEFTASGGNSWNTNTVAAGAAGYNANIYLTPPDNVSLSATSTYAQSWSCTGDPCFEEVQSQTPADPVFFGETSPGNFVVETEGVWTFTVNTNGNVINNSVPVSCTSTCATNLGNGTLQTYSGQMSGEILEGSTTASPLALTISGWGSIPPVCLAQDVNAPAIVGAVTTSSTLTLTFTAHSGNHVKYLCGQD